MRVTGINANLPVADIAATRDFYTDYLGFSVEEFNIGWVARYSTPGGDASVQLVTSDATAPHDSVISVHVGDSVDDAYEEAKRRRYEIVHPLTDEAWGVRRFLVRAPGRQRDQSCQPRGRVGAPSPTSITDRPAPLTEAAGETTSTFFDREQCRNWAPRTHERVRIRPWNGKRRQRETRPGERDQAASMRLAGRHRSASRDDVSFAQHPARRSNPSTPDRRLAPFVGTGGMSECLRDGRVGPLEPRAGIESA